MCNLGSILENRGNDDEARALFQRAVDAGYSRAGFYLARQADRLGHKAETQRWLEFAADRGDTESMLVLAKRAFYAKDFEQARHWGSRAAAAGSREAQELFVQIP
jgi:TPR repeat protein